jgi:hypothetical protein
VLNHPDPLLVTLCSVNWRVFDTNWIVKSYRRERQTERDRERERDRQTDRQRKRDREVNRVNIGASDHKDSDLRIAEIVP